MEQIMRLRGKENVVGGSVGFFAESISPSTVTVTACDEDARVGDAEDGIAYSTVKQIADLLSEAGIPTQTTTEIEKTIWNNALLGCALDGLAAVLGANYGFLAEHEVARKLISDIVRELFAVLDKENRKVDWPDSEMYLRDLFERLIPPRRERHSPMFRDIQDGKRTEIEAFNGTIVDIAHIHGIDVPVNWLVTNLVKVREKIASGKRVH
jgi:2-dehydropantoate 2-reductase